jgi:EAL domain-containing protein (putative c-di-GMP-specific phosphodiesterase class I)
MLGHKLGMTVTAEGIEQGAQASRLSAMGCDEFQGFFFGRPMPAETVALMLEAQAQSRIA